MKFLLREMLSKASPWQPVLRLLFTLATVLAVSACDFITEQPQSPVTLRGPTMGTSYSVVLPPSTTVNRASALKADISALLISINSQMSTYESTSDLSILNRSDSESWQQLPTELIAVIKAAQEVAAQSEGAFDITVGPLVNLWGFGPNGSPQQVPTAAQLAAAKKQVGYQNIKLDTAASKLRKSPASIYIDLSAIAKGYAVDRVAELLDRRQINHYLVEIGGEMRARGHNHRGEPWRIGIERPDASLHRHAQRIIPLTDIGIASSGDYRNYFEEQGQRFSHTIDPRTGKPITHKLASVTVLHKQSMFADAYATAINVLGPEAGLRFAERHQLATLMLIKHENRFLERYSSKMRAILKIDDPAGAPAGSQE